MGIKGLNQLLKRVCNGTHLSMVPAANFRDKTIAVDATLYVCMFKMKANYIETIVDFMTMFRSNGINAFFVFDGTAPDEKQDERLARSDRRNAQQERINKIETDLETYIKTGDASELLRSISIKTRRLAPKILSVQAIRDYIDRLRSQLVVLTNDDFQMMKDVLEAFGMHYTIAPSEGEFMCAALNRHGLVDAVMTADTDALACLAPNVINKVVDNHFQIVSLHDVLSNMKLDEKQFVDLCIMCGTDFNTNITRIGPIGSYEYILRYKSIDNIPLNVDCLNHVRVREIFGSTDIRPNIVIPPCGEIDHTLLEKYKIDITKRLSVIRHLKTS